MRIEAVRGLRDRRGAVHAGSFLRERRIAFDCAPAEFPRIFVHELFHFVWAQAGNPARLSFEDLVEGGTGGGRARRTGLVRGMAEAGAEPRRPAPRSRRWREYCCESFCDTAAWLYSGVPRHAEFTLAGRYRQRRRAWFLDSVEGRRLSI